MQQYPDQQAPYANPFFQNEEADFMQPRMPQDREVRCFVYLLSFIFIYLYLLYFLFLFLIFFIFILIFYFYK